MKQKKSLKQKAFDRGSFYDTVIFDLVGVLLQISKSKAFTNLGFFNVIRHIFVHKKNPITSYLELMNKLADKEGPTEKNIWYKQYRQPKCVMECMLGKKSIEQTAKEINCCIEQLDKNKFFASTLDKNLMLQISDLSYGKKSLIMYADLNQKVFNLIKKIRSTKMHKVFLLTNIDSQSFNILKTTYKKVFALFDGIVASCSVQLLKPNKKIYEHLLETYRINAKNSVFIDDQKENITAAKNIGITGIQYKNFWQVERELTRLGIL